MLRSLKIMHQRLEKVKSKILVKVNRQRQLEGLVPFADFDSFQLSQQLSLYRNKKLKS